MVRPKSPSRSLTRQTHDMWYLPKEVRQQPIISEASHSVYVGENSTHSRRTLHRFFS
jgi:hypothetical protein